MDRTELNNLLLGGQGKSAEEVKNSAICWGICVVGLVILTVACWFLREEPSSQPIGSVAESRP